MTIERLRERFLRRIIRPKNLPKHCHWDPALWVIPKGAVRLGQDYAPGSVLRCDPGKVLVIPARPWDHLWQHVHRMIEGW